MGPKKAKGQKLDLSTFMQDTTLGSWADEMEDAPMPSAPAGRSGYGGEKSYGSSQAYGSGDRGGYSVRQELPLPSKPPFTVHVGNMPFDATNGDVEDFFRDCAVSSVRIVEDKMDQKPKGFAYVEFRTLEGIKKALDLNGTQFMGRNIRISVAEPQKERAESSRDLSDWSRKGPLPDAPGSRRGPDKGTFGSERNERGPPRNFDSASDAGGDRGPRRGGFEPAGDGKIRDFGNWDRKGPLTPTLPPEKAPARSFERHVDRPISRDGPTMRRNSPAWGEGRTGGGSQDGGSRPPRRDFSDRPPPVERVPTAAEQDNQWRAKMRPDAPPQPAPAPAAAVTPQTARSPAHSNSHSSNPPSPAPGPAAPASRPKLNLAKRTVSESQPEAPVAPKNDSKASPFGAARPVDTATKEKEVEEKRQQALKEKKEADEKARAEKKAADDKAKEEKKAARLADEATKSQEPAQSPKDKVTGPKFEKPIKGEKENGSAEKPAGKNYEILRRDASADISSADEEADQADLAGEKGPLSGDKEVKPREIVRDPPSTNGGTPKTSVEPTAEALADEGWETVSKATKGRKTGSTTPRALAS